MNIFIRRIVLCGSILFTILICHSCFEIIEEVNINEDGSGSFCLTINMSQSKLNINSLLLLDSVNGRRMPKVADAKEMLAKIETALKKDSGISNVLIKQNWESYIFSVSGNFKNVVALNRSINNINVMFNEAGMYSPQTHDHYSYNNKVFKRLYNYNLVNEYNSLSEKDKIVLKNATLTSIYRFPTLINSYSNSNALKSKNGKALMLKTNINDLVTNKKSIENSINLN